MAKKTNKSAKEKVQDKIADLLKKSEEMNIRKKELEAIAEERISYAKSRLMSMEGFFAMLLFKMPTSPCYQIPSMATDGSTLLYNPAFVAGESMGTDEHGNPIPGLFRKDVLFVILHEVCHVFWKHCWRGPIKNVNAKKMMDKWAEIQKRGVEDVFTELEIKRMEHVLKEWNYATDYVINNYIINTLKVKCSKQLEQQMLYDKQYADMTSEAVYDKIKTPFNVKVEKANTAGEGDADGQQNGEGNDDKGLGIGGVLPAGFGELTEEDVKVLEKEFDQDVKSALMVSKNAGNVPAGIDDVIESLYETTTPWQDVFRTIFTSINKQDYTFQYPNKRYMQHSMQYGAILPSLYGEEYIKVGLIVDTSGSMGDEEKKIVASEIKNILEDYDIELHVLCCDTKAYVDDVKKYTSDDIRNGVVEMNIKGGGGTAMRPAFDYFREQEYFQVVICLTDMYLFDWGELGPTPEFSTYWAMLPGHSSKVDVDFGTKIEILLDDNNDV